MSAAEEKKVDELPPPRMELASLSPEEIAERTKGMSKDDRKAFHEERRRAQQLQKEGGDGGAAEAKPKQLTKAERREIQEKQRKAKDDVKAGVNDAEELLKELKLQGLSEDQAKVLMEEMVSGKGPQHSPDDDDEDEDEDEETLVQSVARWMKEQETKPAFSGPDAGKELLHEFNLSVRFQGHVDSTPPDHIVAILEVLAGKVCVEECDLSQEKKLNPGQIAKAAGPIFERWIPLIDSLYSKISDSMEAADALVGGVHDAVKAASAKTGATDHNRDCAVVGHLMAIREETDDIPDEDIVTGGKRLDAHGPVLVQYLEFLDDDDSDDSSDSGSD